MDSNRLLLTNHIKGIGMEEALMPWCQCKGNRFICLDFDGLLHLCRYKE